MALGSRFVSAGPGGRLRSIYPQRETPAVLPYRCQPAPLLAVGDIRGARLRSGECGSREAVPTARARWPLQRCSDPRPRVQRRLAEGEWEEGVGGPASGVRRTVPSPSRALRESPGFHYLLLCAGAAVDEGMGADMISMPPRRNSTGRHQSPAVGAWARCSSLSNLLLLLPSITCFPDAYSSRSNC